MTERGSFTVRPYRPEDLGEVVEYWRSRGVVPYGPDGLSLAEATDLVSNEASVTLVADDRGEIVGTVVGTVSGSIGSVHRIVGEDGVCEQLLEELESLLVDRGARKMTAQLRSAPDLAQRLLEAGYEEVQGASVFERELSPTVVGPGVLAQLGGRMVDPGLWDALQGMQEEKDIIERRLILPHAQPELAERHGVVPPGAVVLFGPPGTGKTTFAKGVASRLRWPFVPVEPAQFTGGDDEWRWLAETFDRLLDLPAVVAFVDEVEDIASDRQDERRVGSRITNEFLKQIPRIREAPHHLLICATNLVGDLDPAFLRPGRFDYIVPVGPPDARARHAIWGGYVEEITGEEIDLDALVAATERYTPADIEFAARKAAHIAFEGEYFADATHRATTDDFLEAIAGTRPTLTQEMVHAFERDSERYARF